MLKLKTVSRYIWRRAGRQVAWLMLRAQKPMYLGTVCSRWQQMNQRSLLTLLLSKNGQNVNMDGKTCRAGFFLWSYFRLHIWYGFCSVNFFSKHCRYHAWQPIKRVFERSIGMRVQWQEHQVTIESECMSVLSAKCTWEDERSLQKKRMLSVLYCSWTRCRLTGFGPSFYESTACKMCHGLYKSLLNIRIGLPQPQ